MTSLFRQHLEQQDNSKCSQNLSRIDHNYSRRRDRRREEREEKREEREEKKRREKREEEKRREKREKEKRREKREKEKKERRREGGVTLRTHPKTSHLRSMDRPHRRYWSDTCGSKQWCL